MSEQHSSRFIDGLVFGGLVGTALGLLFAPVVGDNIRSQIRSKLKDFNLDETISRISEAFEEGKKEAEKAMQEVA